MPLIRCTRADDPRLDAFCRLTNHQLRNKLDPAAGRCIVESEIALRVGLEEGLEPESFLFDEKRLERMADVIEAHPDVPVYVLPPSESEKLTGFRVTRGILGCLRRPSPADAGALLADARRVCVLEDIVDTTNVGAIFRSAAALGVDAVLLAPNCADPLSRRAVRVSMGNVFRVPWARLEGTWPEDGLAQVRDAGFFVAALALSDDAVALDDPSLARHERLAMLFGTEGDGLTARAIAGADAVVTIPMSHDVDSLNVAAASAVTFWELCR